MKKGLLLFAWLIACSAYAQSNVRAWYADGQVWVIWNIELPVAETVEIYAHPTPFTTTLQATRIGKSYFLDYLPTALKEQVDTFATFQIPTDTGMYTLALDEGLFVFTPHQSGSLYFAVVPGGETSVTKDSQITDDTVAFDYDPIGDPVECHRQAVFPSPFTSGYVCAAYYMWVDGRDDYRDGRPDFPVMANAAKNGMPGFFMISAPIDLDTTQPFPLTVWLHGGEGNSRQSLAGSRNEININPRLGILLSHNDDMFGIRDTFPAKPANPTWHFGWRKSYDPFTFGNLPTETDTIINYTQRRYLWIDEWLIRHFTIDTARIHINGHSMGSAGATALAKAYPNHYASATIFNNGFGVHEPGTGQSALFGEPDLNFPTNLTNRSGETVHIKELFDIIHLISSERDLPVFRSYHGKNDADGVMRWDPEVIENYRTADSSAHGMHLFWSERPHGVDMAPAFNDHWIMGIAPTLQTITDNVSWEETQFRSDIGYPAFYNHRHDVNAQDPGDGTQGTGPNGDGDDWGTWGGWHRWDNATLIDQPGIWAVDVWLEADAAFDNDNCPFASLTADLAIRKPALFRPVAGDLIGWKVEDLTTQIVLQTGTTIAGPDGLVSVGGIIVFPVSDRKVRITFTTDGVSTQENKNQHPVQVIVFPNPGRGDITLKIFNPLLQKGNIHICNSTGQRILANEVLLVEGVNAISIPASAAWPCGTYFIRVNTSTSMMTSSWIKIE